MNRKKTAAILVLTMLVSLLQGFSPVAIYATGTTSSNDRLINLVVDEVAQVQMDFEPATRNYGKYYAYMSVEELHVWAVPEKKGAKITINGETPQISGGDLPQPSNDYGRVTVYFDESYRDSTNPEINGKAEIKVQVEGGEPYTFIVYRVDVDYRGRKQLPIINATASSSATSTKYQPQWAYDGDISDTSGKGWKPVDTFKGTGEMAEVKHGTMSQGEISNVAGHHITFELDKPYVVSRVTGFWDIRDGKGMTHWSTVPGDIWRYLLEISVSMDGENFKTVANMANFRDRRPYFGYNSDNMMVSTTNPSEPFTRYEFDDNYEAKYIRLKFAQYEYNSAKVSVPKLKEAIFYGWDVGDNRIPKPSSEEIESTPYIPSSDKISRANEVMMEKGMEISTWVPSGDYGRGTYDAREWEKTNMSSMILYDVPFQISNIMKYNPNMQWGLAKAPTGLNGIVDAGEPRPFVPKEMAPYYTNAITFCFGDERPLTPSEVTGFAKWFEYSKANYPHVLLHTNQTGEQAQQYSYMADYIKRAKPDMLTMDHYPWSGGGMGNVGGFLGDTKKLTEMATYQRKDALGGIERDGSKPLVFGQYISSYNREYSESQKNVLSYISLATGMKWLNMWRSEFAFDEGNTFDYDGVPKRGLLEWGELFGEIRNMEDYIVRLNSDTVVTVPGQNANGTENAVVRRDAGNGVGDVGKFSEQSSKNNEYFIENVQAENISKYNLNNGNSGDIVLGYFKPLPGLTATQIKEQFGSESIKAFMLVNGFFNGLDSRHSGNPQPIDNYKSNKPSDMYANIMNRVQEDYGSKRETEQKITITFTHNAPDTLMKVSKENKNQAIPVPITINEDGSKSITAIMGGGSGDLYFWAEDASVVYTASTQVEGHEAELAFDKDGNTYWQSEESDIANAYIEHTFETEQLVSKIGINELGDNISSYQLEYLIPEDGLWKPLEGGSGTVIGEDYLLTLNKATTIKGIRLTIKQASNAPAISEITLVKADIPPMIDGKYYTEINDSVVGSGYNQIQYGFYEDDNLDFSNISQLTLDDSKINISKAGEWIYREPVADKQYFPAYEGDIHFTFKPKDIVVIKFNGDRIRLSSRKGNNNGYAHIFIDGAYAGDINQYQNNVAYEQEVFDSNISLTQGDHTATIVVENGKIASNYEQFNIDKVEIYSQEIPPENRIGNWATYVDSHTIGTGLNQIEYIGSWIGSNRRHGNDTNSDYYTSTENNASYRMKFKGDSVEIVAPSKNIADATVKIDGVTVGTIQKFTPYSKTGTGHGNQISLGRFHVPPNRNLPLTTSSAYTVTTGSAINYNLYQNDDIHTLEVEFTKTGTDVARVDHIIVYDSYPKEVSYSITVNNNTPSEGSVIQEGTSQIGANRSFVLEFMPQEGYLPVISINGLEKEVRDNRYLITNIRYNQVVDVSFKQVDKTNLGAKLEEAKSKDVNQYTEATMYNLQKAIEGAQVVYDSPTATQKEVDYQIVILNSNIRALLEKYSILFNVDPNRS